MPTVAAIPALALLAGCAAGLLWPGLPGPLEVAILVISAAGALLAWRRARPILLAAAVAAAFVSGGALLAARAWQEAWRPSLRVVFEELAHSEHLGSDETATTTIAGVLRADASPTSVGASLSMDVREIETPAPRAVSGGVLLTVVGDIARERADQWRAGRVVRAPVQLRRPSRYLDPGVPDEERLLARRGTTLVGTVKSGGLVDVAARGGLAAEAAASLRAFVRRAVAASVGRWNARAAAIVTAIVIGDRAGLDDQVQLSLQEAGTYHVIAISGGNIAILAGLTLGAFRIAGLLGRAAMAVAIGGLIAYGYLVGGGASVDRATLMAVVYFAGRAIDQRGPPFNTLAVVAGLLVASDPLTLADPAFLLTFGATAAILAVMPALALQRMPKFVGPAVAMFAASVASEAALLPVSAYVFSRVTFAGLALNFAAIPLMAVAQVAGMALVPAALVSAHLASAIGWVAYIGAEGLVRSASLVRFAPAVTWRVAPPGWPVIVLYYAGFIAAWVLWRRRSLNPVNPVNPVNLVNPARGAATACAIAAALWLLLEPWTALRNRGDGQLHITFIDVGQGDSAFVRFPRGAALLVDAGGLPGSSSFDIGDRVVAPVLRDSGVRRLQTIALTHGDNDHIGGAASLIREFRPADVWEGVPVPPLRPLQALHVVAGQSRARWTNVQAGDRTTIDGVDVVVRNPALPDWERQHVRNDDSVVIELLWQDVSVVLTGDAGASTEGLITPLFAPAPIRIVKVPHHGSRTSSTVPFVRALAPRVAVVSVGRNNTFGHPAPEVIERYQSAGADVFRTDRDGAVTVDTDGHRVNVHGYTGRVWSNHEEHEGHEEKQ